MAAQPVTPLPAAPAPKGGLLAHVLGFDSPEADAVKWIAFARNLLLVFAASVIGVSAILTYNSVSSTRAALIEALDAKGGTIASAAARAAFVPLSLKDEAGLKTIADGYSKDPDLAFIEVREPGSGLAVRYDGAEIGDGGRAIVRSAEVAAPAEYADAGLGEPRAAGIVTAGMSTARIERTLAVIARRNALGTGVLLLLILSLGTYLIRQMTHRQRELVGEARLVEAVRQANAELEAFSYSVAHDLRAPLRHINGFIELIQESGMAPTDENKRYFGIVAESSVRLGTMIDALLNFSRMGRAQLRPERVELKMVASAVWQELSPELKDRAVEWTLGELPAAYCDPTMTRLVFQNLLSNALKYSRGRAPARISVSGRPDGRSVVISVRDNGAGFDMKYSDKLFGVFQRLHRAEEFEGTGIGLANVRRIVTRHGGKIWAESAPGQGSVFHFSLPSEDNKGAQS